MTGIDKPIVIGLYSEQLEGQTLVTHKTIESFLSAVNENKPEYVLRYSHSYYPRAVSHEHPSTVATFIDKNGCLQTYAQRYRFCEFDPHKPGRDRIVKELENAKVKQISGFFEVERSGDLYMIIQSDTIDGCNAQVWNWTQIIKSEFAKTGDFSNWNVHYANVGENQWVVSLSIGKKHIITIANDELRYPISRIRNELKRIPEVACTLPITVSRCRKIWSGGRDIKYIKD